jgi:hypothetical protein
MPIGKGCITESEQQRYGLKICENELLLLGVYIGKNQSQCNELKIVTARLPKHTIRHLLGSLA